MRGSGSDRPRRNARGCRRRTGVPELFRVTATDLADELLEECFCPTALVVEYAAADELVNTLSRLPGQLTASLHAADDDNPTGIPRRIDGQWEG